MKLFAGLALTLLSSAAFAHPGHHGPHHGHHGPRGPWHHHHGRHGGHHHGRRAALMTGEYHNPTTGAVLCHAGYEYKNVVMASSGAKFSQVPTGKRCSSEFSL